MKEIELKDKAKKIKWLYTKGGIKHCESLMYVNDGELRLDIKDEQGKWQEVKR